MLKNVKVLYHSSIRINKEKIIYIDPYNVDIKYNDADLIFITHSHYDHYSKEDIDKVKKDDTIIIAPKDLEEKIQNDGFSPENIVIVTPNEAYEVGNIRFETVRAYNINKQFHPKSNDWVGYILNLDDGRYYIAGDTDDNEDNRKVKCDVAFVPVGGTFTMTAEEAAGLINVIKPKIAVPIHYGGIVGTQEDANRFIDLLDNDIDGEILL